MASYPGGIGAALGEELMNNLKAILATLCVVFALTGSAAYMASDISSLPDSDLESESARVQDIMRDKLGNAELSLKQQADALTKDDAFVTELANVRSRLLSMTPAELKQQTRNRWNMPVFDRLLNWKEARDSEITQQKATLPERMKAENGSMSEQLSLMNWWGKGPDLVLAFASVPMKDGKDSATLVAYAQKGKELQNGKRYDEDIRALRIVQASHQPVFDHFAWDGKMYMAAVHPVTAGEEWIGSVVVGMAVSRDGFAALDRVLPDYADLSIVYAKPRFGKDGQRVIYSDDVKSYLEFERFTPNGSRNNGDAVLYDKIQPNTVYVSDKNHAVVRVPWVWNADEETDLYIVADLEQAAKPGAELRRNICIAGLLAAVLGVILALLLVNRTQRNMRKIRKGIGEAIASGNPIAGDVLSAMTGENADDLGEFTLQRVETQNEDTPQDWNNLMMDFDDDANKAADRAVSKEEMDALKSQSDIDEATALYEEYMKVRKENHIDTPMDFDCFLRRLKRNIEMIKSTYHCEEVHFEVRVDNGKVNLKPLISKKK